MLETKELYQQKLIIQMIQLYLVPQKKQINFFEIYNFIKLGKNLKLRTSLSKNWDHMIKIQRKK
ncbi:unnamed protein product [Paramecium primaurelia]|uniref:Uncharacterized protein n=1 Tax=Paramecium primaurelia TaxID=5886 RepID=A0A8S1LBH1_PARPR|nr:unnamed protein product [Paramecium primaurelia]